MSKNYEEDAVNRCRRCNRPLSNPNDSYGWWCAKLLGLGDYVKDDKLDDNGLSVYNEDEYKHSQVLKGNFEVEGFGYKNSFVVNQKRNGHIVITEIPLFGKSFQAQYDIVDGAIHLEFDKNEYFDILSRGGSRTLAKAMYYAAKELSPDNLSGRTIDGINTELQLHWAAYKLKIKKENARKADIGGIINNRNDYDSNAWLFEGIQLTDDLLNPKKSEVLIRKLWGYLK